MRIRDKQGKFKKLTNTEKWVSMSATKKSEDSKPWATERDQIVSLNIDEGAIDFFNDVDFQTRREEISLEDKINLSLAKIDLFQEYLERETENPLGITKVLEFLGVRLELIAQEGSKAKEDLAQWPKGWYYRSGKDKIPHFKTYDLNSYAYCKQQYRKTKEKINLFMEDLEYWSFIGGADSESPYLETQMRREQEKLRKARQNATNHDMSQIITSQLMEDELKVPEKMDFWLVNDLKYRLDGLTYKDKEGQVVTRVMTYEEMEKYLEGIDILYQRKEISLKTFVESSLAVLARMKNFSTERVVYRDIPSIEDMDTGVRDEYESFLKKWKTFNKVNVVASSSSSIKEDEIIASVDREKAISRRWRRLKKNLVWRAKDLNFEIIVKAARLQASIGDILSAKKGKKAYIS